jgi:hypothetical protein
MKTATVEQRPVGSDAMVNLSISICVGSWCCWWLRVGEAAYKGFFVKGGSVMVTVGGAVAVHSSAVAPPRGAHD